MNKNHFVFSYFGNKRQECKFIYDNIEDTLKEVKTIIEPYCGSSAISYYISIKQPKKFKYILNDNDENLIKLYKLMKDNDEKEITNFENTFNELINNFNSYDNDNDRKPYYESIKKYNNLCSYLFTHKYYAIRFGLYPPMTKINKIKPFKFIDYPIYHFLINEDVEILNNDALDLFKDFKDKGKDNFIILDPPYMALNNDLYSNKSVNIYEYLYYNNIDNMNSNIILVLENMWIIKLLFKDNNKSDEYDKKYMSNKKKTKHIIIKN